jgi:tetratricopeptide (TPR) repeat protein
MQQMAPPGEIWVADATYRVARDAFEWQALGSQRVKGKAESVSVYALQGRRDVHSRFEVLARRGLTPLIGREAERQQLLEVWVQAQHGQGRVVSIVGEAGLGKSRLLYEFKQQLRQQGARCVEGTCFTYGESISYLPFLEMIHAICELEPNRSEAEAKRQIASHLDTLGLLPSAVIPYLHNLLSLTVEDDVFPQLTSELIRRRTVEALKTLVLAEAQHQPLALVLEDVHWIDKATEEVLGTIVEAMTEVPLLLVLVYRPEYVQSWIVQAIHTKAYARQVKLEPLSIAQRSEMTQALLGAIPPELEALIVDKTDGNPLFVEELCRSLVENGVLEYGDGHYILHARLDTLDIPTTLQGVLLARIDRLPETLKDVLQRAAVIGRVFTHSLLIHVVDNVTALEHQLIQLEALEFIYPISLAPEREYSFKHVLTQEAVYQTLLRPRREAHHERVGKALEALHLDHLEEVYERLAYHYVRSGNKDKAVEYLHLSNQKASKANAMEEAKSYFDTAMTLLDSLSETEENQQRRIALLVNQGDMFLLLFKFPEYYDMLTRYEPMALRLGNPWLLGAFYTRMGHCEWSFGAFDQAIPTLIKAAKLCEDAGNTEDAGDAYLTQEWAHLDQGDYDQVFTLKEQVLRTMGSQFNLRDYTYTFTAASLAHTWYGHWDEAVEEAQRSLRIGEEFSDGSLIAFSAWVIAYAYLHKGDLTQALEYAELGVQKAPTPGDKMWAQATLACALCRAGNPNRCVEFLTEIIPVFRAGRFVSMELFYTLFLGEGYWLVGEYDKARHTLEECLDIVERCGMKFFIGSAHRLLGEMALTTSPTALEVPVAASHFEKSIAVLREIKAENELGLVYADYGRLHQQQGNFTQARAYLTQALEIFERLGTLGEPEKVRQTLAAVSSEEGIGLAGSRDTLTP